MPNVKREIAAVLVAATIMAQMPQALGRAPCAMGECEPSGGSVGGEPIEPPDEVPVAEPPAGEPIEQSAMALRQPEFLSLGGSPETISAAALVTNATKRQTLIQVYGEAGALFADGPALDKAFVDLLRQLQRTGTGTVGADTLRAPVTIDRHGNVNGAPLASDNELAVTSHLIDLSHSERAAALQQVGVDTRGFDDRTILNFFNRVEIRRQLGGPGAVAMDFATVEEQLPAQGDAEPTYQTVTIGARFEVRADGAIMTTRGTWERPTSERAYGQRRDFEHREWPGGLPELRDVGAQDTYSRLYRQAAQLSPEVMALALRDLGVDADWTTRAFPQELAVVLAHARVAMTVAGPATYRQWYGYPSLTPGTDPENRPPDDLFMVALTFTSDGQGHIDGRVPVSESAIATQLGMERMPMVEKRLLLRQAGLPFEAVRTITPLAAATVLTTVTMFQKEPGDHSYTFDANGAHWLGAVSIAADGSIVGGAAMKLPPEQPWWREAIGPVLAIVSLAFPAVAPYAAVINAGIQIDSGARGIALFASIASAAAGVSAISDSAQGLATASSTTQNLTVVATALNATSSLNNAVKNKDVLGLFVAIVSLADAVGTMTNTKLDSSFDLVRQAATVTGLLQRLRDGDIVGLGTQVIGGFMAQEAARPTLERQTTDFAKLRAGTAAQSSFNSALYSAMAEGRSVFMFDLGDGNGAQPFVTSLELEPLALLLRASKDASHSSLQGSSLSPVLAEFSDAAPQDSQMRNVLFTQALEALRAQTGAQAAQRIDELNAVDDGVMHPNPTSRLGAYEATRGYPPGTVGFAVHSAFGAIYQVMGAVGENEIGNVANSNAAKLLYALPLSDENSSRYSELEYGYWTTEYNRDPMNLGARIGAALSVQEQAYFRMYSVANITADAPSGEKVQPGAAVKGNLFFGGAGMDGGYITDMVRAFETQSIKLQPVNRDIWSGGTALDATFGVDVLRYGASPWTVLIDAPDQVNQTQFNLVGYSYGSLVAAQVAQKYGEAGTYVDNLVLVGSPISEAFLTALRNNPNIGRVIVVDLVSQGDPIYAGMGRDTLVLSAPKLAWQMLNGTGHFYYAPNTPAGAQRRNEFAKFLRQLGFR